MEKGCCLKMPASLFVSLPPVNVPPSISRPEAVSPPLIISNITQHLHRVLNSWKPDYWRIISTKAACATMAFGKHQHGVS